MNKINVVVSRINGEDHHEITNQSELVELLTKLDLAEDFIFEVDGVIYDDVDFDELFKKDIQLIRVVDYPKGGVGKALGKVLGFVFKPIMKLLGFGKSPEYAVPDAVRQAKESPNNRLTQQTNVTRLFQARPESFGIMRAYPDLINQSLYEYVNNEKIITEIMNIGIGYYNVRDIRYAESKLELTGGASSIIYQPNEVIPEIVEPFEFPDVDIIELIGLNEAGQTTGEVVFTQGAELNVFTIPDNTRTSWLKTKLNQLVNVFIPIIEIDSEITSTLTDFAKILSVSSASGKITLKLEMNNTLPIGAKYDSNRITLSSGTQKVSGPFVSPIESEYLWFNMYARLSGAVTASYKLNYIKIDDNNIDISGTDGSVTGSFTGKSGVADTYYRTIKVKPAAGFGRYRITVERTNNSGSDNQLFFEEIFAINIRRNVVHPKDTIIKIQVRAVSEQGRTRRYNAMIDQRTIYWNGQKVVGYNPNAPYLYNPDELKGSRAFADAVLHSWLIRAKMPLSMIDVEGLYKIQNSLPDPRIGYFDYTFDDLDTSLGNRIEVICGVADVIAYWDGGILRFSRDEKKTIPSALFNPANTILQNFRSSYELNLPRGYDGIELKFVNPDNNKFDFIYYKIVNGMISKDYSEKPMKINLIGCRDKYQAEQRAIKEARKLLYGRKTIQIRTFGEAETLPMGALVLYADILNTDYITGYVNSINGDKIEVNEKITLTSGKISISKKDGTVATATFTKQSDFVIQLTTGINSTDLLQFDGINVQAPSRFVVYASNIEPEKYTLENKKPTGDGMWDLTLRQYDERIYL